MNSIAYQRGYPAGPATARATAYLPGMSEGNVGRALMSFGVFLGCVRGDGTTGIDAPIEVFWEPNVDGSPDLFITSAGFVVIVLGLLVILGAALGRGGLARVGAVLGIVAVVLFIVTRYRADENLGDVGIGVWLILVGSIVALVGGFLSRRPVMAPPV